MIYNELTSNLTVWVCTTFLSHFSVSPLPLPSSFDSTSHWSLEEMKCVIYSKIFLYVISESRLIIGDEIYPITKQPNYDMTQDNREDSSNAFILVSSSFPLLLLYFALIPFFITVWLSMTSVTYLFVLQSIKFLSIPCVLFRLWTPESLHDSTNDSNVFYQ